MKKLLTVILAVFLILGLIINACSSKKKNPAGPQSTNTPMPDTLVIDDFENGQINWIGSIDANATSFSAPEISSNAQSGSYAMKVTIVVDATQASNTSYYEEATVMTIKCNKSINCTCGSGGGGFTGCIQGLDLSGYLNFVFAAADNMLQTPSNGNITYFIVLDGVSSGCNDCNCLCNTNTLGTTGYVESTFIPVNTAGTWAVMTKSMSDFNVPAGAAYTKEDILKSVDGIEFGVRLDSALQGDITRLDLYLDNIKFTH